jgi:hypothetical protein
MYQWIRTPDKVCCLIAYSLFFFFGGTHMNKIFHFDLCITNEYCPYMFSRKTNNCGIYTNVHSQSLTGI